MEKCEDDIIDLNVGGTYFTTYKSTVLSHLTEGSMLSAMFSGRHPLKKDSQGRFFIDRPPEPFRWILDVLRRGHYFKPESDYLRNNILIELDYYTLKHPLFDRLLFNTRIKLTDTEISTLCEWINHQPCELLYRASRDSWKPEIFHFNCDNKGPTLVIAETTCGQVFGGYTECNWDETKNPPFKSEYIGCSWIFSLRYSGKSSRYFTTGTLYHLNEGSFGPIFGANEIIFLRQGRRTVEFDRFNQRKTYQINPLGIIGKDKADLSEFEVYMIPKVGDDRIRLLTQI